MELNFMPLIFPMMLKDWFDSQIFMDNAKLINETCYRVDALTLPEPLKSVAITMTDNMIWNAYWIVHESLRRFGLFWKRVEEDWSHE